MSGDENGAYSPTWCLVTSPAPGTGWLCRLPGWPHDDHVATTPDGGDVRWTTAKTDSGATP